MAHEPCPSAADLGAFHRGDLPLDRAERLAAHLESCPTCEASLQRLDAGERSVAGLLRDDGSPAFETVSAPGAKSGAADRSASVHVGRYKLIEPLGEGGMGAVFMAQQSEPVRRLVAIKVIRPGMDSRQILARFEAERQALALMDHPNIARVLDAGTTATGQPYFAMELVKGVPITQYCDDHRLSVRERLELFVPVCRAVQHAHQKGIIHRDIKPSNVLVARYDGEPVPKVIDFGVAKAIGQPLTDLTLVTNFGSVVGTPEYMAPEQAEMNQADVDTRCDVYALGVLLYQLLTGSTPLTRQRMGEAAIFEILRLVREEEAPRPSTRLSSSEALPSLAASRKAEPAALAALVRGELDWVAMRALEKDRNRRYDTPGALARDVERYLADEAVEAAPPTAAYRFRKFARRHRGALRLAGLVAALLVAATAVSTWQAIRATKAEQAAVRAGLAARDERDQKEVALRKAQAEEQKARDELATRNSVIRFFKDVFAVGRPVGFLGGLGSDVSLHKAIDVTVERLGTNFGDRPLIEAIFRHDIGNTYFYLNDNRNAAVQFERAYNLIRAETGADSPETLEYGQSLGMALTQGGDPKRAMPFLKRALAGYLATVGPDDLLTWRARFSVAQADAAEGRVDEAIAVTEQGLKVRRERQLLRGEDTLAEVAVLSRWYRAKDRVDDSIRLLEEFIPISEATLGPRQPTTTTLKYNLAQSYVTQDRQADAVALFLAVIEDARATHGPHSTRTLMYLDELAKAYDEAGQSAAAADLGAANLAAIREKEGPDSFGALVLGLNQGYYCGRAGRTAEAVGLMEDVVQRQKARLKPDHFYVVMFEAWAARTMLEAGRDDLARPLLADVLARVGDRRGDEALMIAERLALIGVAYLDRGRAEEAEAPLRACLAIRTGHRPGDWLEANAKSMLGAALTGRAGASPFEVESLLRAGYDGLFARRADTPPRGRNNLPLALDRLIRFAELANRPAEVATWKAERAKYPTPFKPPFLR